MSLAPIDGLVEWNRATKRLWVLMTASLEEPSDLSAGGRTTLEGRRQEKEGEVHSAVQDKSAGLPERVLGSCISSVYIVRRASERALSSVMTVALSSIGLAESGLRLSQGTNNDCYCRRLDVSCCGKRADGVELLTVLYVAVRHTKG